MEIIFLLGRIVLGVYFIMNGSQHLMKYPMMVQYAASKGVPIPNILVPITGLQIIIGGLSVLLGIYPQIGSWLLVIFLVVVSLFMHRFWEEKDEMTKMTQMVNFAKNLALAGALLMISTIQNWPLSLQLPY